MRAPDHGQADCVVVDVHLPMMDGLQFQAELKRVLPDAAIVFITGQASCRSGFTH
ncbi:MAG: response regulator [Candidatus Binataceae bacterium]